MVSLNKFKVFLALILLAGIFANSATAETCFCGEACSHDSSNNVGGKSHFPFHNHCVGTHCKSCNFEDGQSLKARNSCRPTGSIKIPAPSLFVINLTTFNLDTLTINGYSSHICTFEKVYQSLPIFLQNRALLC